jgi:hypothetical protein
MDIKRARFDDGREVHHGLNVLFAGWFVVATMAVIPAAAEQPQEETAGSGELTAGASVPTTNAVSLELRRPRDEANQRTLRFHAINDPLFGTSPFVAGYVAFRPGGAVGLVDGYQDPDGPTYDLGLAGGSLGMGYGARFGERIGWRGRLDGLVVVGTNEDSQLNAGGVACLTIDTDVVFRLLRDEERGTQLAAHAMIEGHLGFSVSTTSRRTARARRPRCPPRCGPEG